MIKVKITKLLRSGKVFKNDLICDKCFKNCILDRYVYLDTENNKGYCERCYNEKQKIKN